MHVVQYIQPVGLSVGCHGDVCILSLDADDVRSSGGPRADIRFSDRVKLGQGIRGDSDEDVMDGRR